MGDFGLYNGCLRPKEGAVRPEKGVLPACSLVLDFLVEHSFFSLSCSLHLGLLDISGSPESTGKTVINFKV